MFSYVLSYQWSIFRSVVLRERERERGGLVRVSRPLKVLKECIKRMKGTEDDNEINSKNEVDDFVGGLIGRTELRTGGV